MILHYEQEHSGTECPFTKTEEEIKKLTDYKYKYFINFVKLNKLFYNF